MKIKGVIEEDFVNYKKICMTIEMPVCKDFKCDRECGSQVCQNNDLVHQPTINIYLEDLLNLYLSNPITEAICFQGLEPFDSFSDLKECIQHFRSYTQDDIVIYTGYNKNEIKDYLTNLKKYDNIIIKYGRFIPNQKSHYDPVLGVNLASDNQYGEFLWQN